MALSLTPSIQAQEIRLPKTEYAAYDAIIVSYYNSSTPKDWVTVEAVGAPDDAYTGRYYYLGEDSGTVAFDGLAPGRYEVRAYCCWYPYQRGNGGWRVVSRVPFTVR